MDEILKDVSNTAIHNGVELLPGEPLSDLVYADDIVLACDSGLRAQHTLDAIAASSHRFGLSLSARKCKVMVFDWSDPVPNLELGGNVLEVVDKFVYLGSCFSNKGLQDEISGRIIKARAAYTNLRHLWRRRDISLAVKGRVYNASVRSVLLYGCESWPVRVEDLQRLTVFDHRCLRSIARVWWEQRISNEEVRCRVFATNDQRRPVSSILLNNQLRWLGHVLRMPENRLPRRALFARRK
jgi:hypothetical protein